jgi:nitrite reductase/ring-hydroxylating ferredoxin subunit
MPQTSIYRNFEDAPDPRPARHAVLDTARYISPEFMRREWEGVWTKVWLLGGFLKDVPEVGDFVTFEIGHESILITRSAPDTISAVYNVCQHRGNQITTLEQGSVDQIVCPYHGWTYELDGTIKHIPDADRFDQELPCAEVSLKKVRVQVWAGMIWICMDPDGISLEQYLGPVMQEFEQYRTQDMVLVGDQTVLLDANWKTCVDNFNEQYHVDFIHPQHKSYVDCCNAENALYPFGHRRAQAKAYTLDGRYPVPEEVPPVLRAAIEPLGMDPEAFRGRVMDVREAVQKEKRSIAADFGIDFSHFTDEEITDIRQFDVFPNLTMSIRPEELWIMRPRPHPTDPNRCYFDKLTLYAPAKLHPGDGKRRLVGSAAYAHADLAGERPQHEIFTQDDVISGKHSMNLTIDQDIFYLRQMQAGLRSRGFKKAWLNRDESRVQHFHDWLDIWIEGAI